MIINLTQHVATFEQLSEGVQKECFPKIKHLLNFEEIPSKEEMENRAKNIIKFLDENVPNDIYQIMLGGAPYFMPILERKLKELGWEVRYSFSKRISEDVPQEDGTIKKIATFKHVGWVFV